MTSALMNPAPNEYSCTNPLKPSKFCNRLHISPPIRPSDWQQISAFNIDLSHLISCKVKNLYSTTGAKRKGCCYIETKKIRKKKYIKIIVLHIGQSNKVNTINRQQEELYKYCYLFQHYRLITGSVINVLKSIHVV